jgi:predicted RNA-binding Zn ribbon-like protein
MSVTIDLAAVQGGGFPMGGEPLVAIDLVDTLMTAADPSVDLLTEPDRSAWWWDLQAARLPESPKPEPAAARRLRAAIRDLLDAHLEGREPLASSVEDLNAAAASVPSSPRLSYAGSGQTARADVRWHTEYGGNVALNYIAREAIGLLTDPEELAKLRRCASPTCSMLFLADTKRRQWCASNVCGNRARVARHQEKVRAAKRAS